MYIHVPVLIMQEIPFLHLYSGAVSRKERVNNHRSHPGVEIQQFFKEMAKRKPKTSISCIYLIYCILKKKHVVTAVTLKSGRLVVPFSSSYSAKSPRLCLSSLRMELHVPLACVLPNLSAVGPCLLTALFFVTPPPPRLLKFPHFIPPWIPLSWLVDLPASPQCGCISVPCCALFWLVSWQQTTVMTGLQARERERERECPSFAAADSSLQNRGWCAIN